MEYLVKKKNGTNLSISLKDTLFNLEYNEAMVYQLLTSYISNLHIGRKKQKSRSEVRGGGKKPWRQKGTGRARAGSIRSPIWKGGGKIFAANGYPVKLKKINKKVYKTGIKIILSQLMRDKRLFIIDDIYVDNKKTKSFLTEIKYLNDPNYSLFILDNINTNIYFSSRNLNNIAVISCKNLNPFSLIKFKKIFITISSIKILENYLQ